jgi:preprotein translocase subunit SecG
MENVLLVVHVLIVLALIVSVLMQRSEGGALGMGGGGGSGGGGFLTGRGTANLLTRTTAILAVCFFVTSIISTILANRQSTGGSVFDSVGQPKIEEGVPAGGSGDTPASGGGGILDDLQKGRRTLPSVPSGR